MKKVTIFTPSYNRAYILHQCYDSLIRQTNKEFLWLIVDDGSIDDTQELVSRWMQELRIEIRYIKQQNGGKYRAVNAGIANCTTELFLFLDSDDYLTDNAVERLLEVWNNISDKSKISAIMARRGNSEGKVIGSRIPKNIIYSTNAELVEKYGYTGDTCRIYRTEILKQHLFPVIEGENFIPENVMYDKIDMTYRLYILDEILRITEYLNDGYTASFKKLLRNNPNGYALSLKQNILSYKSTKLKIKAVVGYTVWCWNNKIDSFYNCPAKLAYILLLPISVCLFIFRKPNWYFSEKGWNP